MILDYDKNRDVNRYTNQINVIAENGKEIIYSSTSRSYYEYYHVNNAIILTDRNVYRPKQNIFFKTIVNKDYIEQYGNNKTEFNIKIYDPKNKEIFNKNYNLTEYYTLNDSLEIKKEFKLGKYRIAFDNYISTKEIEVIEYKKDEFEVNIKTNSEIYIKDEKIEVDISANYLFGGKLKGAKGKYKIFDTNNYHYYRRLSDEERLKNKNYISSGDFTIDNKTGESLIEIPSNFATNPNNKDFIIVCEVTDKSRRMVSAEKSFKVYPSQYEIIFSNQKNYYTSDETVNLLISINDVKKNNIKKKKNNQIKVKLDITETFKENRRQPNKIKRNIYTDKSGNYLFSHKLKNLSRLDISVKAFDPNQKLVSHSTSFYINDEYTYFSRTEGMIEISTDKEIYSGGEYMDIDISSSVEKNCFVNVFFDDLYHSEIFPLKSNFKKGNRDRKKSFKVKIPDDFKSGNIIIRTIALDNYAYYTDDKILKVINENKLIDIKFEKLNKEYKPGDTVKFKIRTTDKKSMKPISAELSLAVVDKAIFNLKPYISIFEIEGNNNRNGYYYNDLKYKKGGQFSINNRLSYFLNSQQLSDKNRKYLIYFDKVLLNNFVKGKFSQDEDNDKNQGGIGNTIETKSDISKDEMVMEDAEVSEKEMRSSGSSFDNKKSKKISKQNESIAQPSVSAEKNNLENAKNIKIRKKFKDLAYWKAEIVTDKNGYAEIEFKLGDDLTTWQLVSVGVTKKGKLGEKIGFTKTNMPYMAKIQAPRTLTERDKVKISGLLINQTGAKQSVTSKLKLSKGVKLLKNDKKTKSKQLKNSKIKNDATNLVNWDVKVTGKTDSVSIKLISGNKKYNDASIRKYKIVKHGIPLTVSGNDIFKKEGTKEVDFEIGKGNIDKGKISFSSNIAGKMFESLGYLIGFPYGCVEQTMSRFLPTVYIYETVEKLNISNNSEKLEKMPEYIEAGLERLINFQHSDGGWGWWETDNTNPYMTAYVLYGLSKLDDINWQYDKKIKTRGVKALENLLKTEKDADTYVYMVYSIYRCKQDVKKYLKKMLLKESKMNNYTKSLWAIMENDKGSKYNASRIIKSIKLHGSKKGRYIDGKQWHYNWTDNKIESTAIYLKALLQIDPNSDYIDDLVTYLVNSSDGGYWHSTKETATVVYALSDYLLKEKLENKFYSCTVFVNNWKLGDFDLKGSDLEPKILEINNQYLKNGKNSIKITKKGKGKLFFDYSANYYSEEENLRATNNGFKVKREYYKSIPDDSSNVGKEKLVLLKDGEILKSGDEIMISITVDAEKLYRYVMIEDYFPSGFEYVDQMGEGKNTDNNNWWSRYSNSTQQMEKRDEKVAFFIDYFPIEKKNIYLQNES